MLIVLWAHRLIINDALKLLVKISKCISTSSLSFSFRCKTFLFLIPTQHLHLTYRTSRRYFSLQRENTQQNAYPLKKRITLERYFTHFVCYQTVKICKDGNKNEDGMLFVLDCSNSLTQYKKTVCLCVCLNQSIVVCLVYYLFRIVVVGSGCQLLFWILGPVRASWESWVSRHWAREDREMWGASWQLSGSLSNPEYIT